METDSAKLRGFCFKSAPSAKVMKVVAVLPFPHAPSRRGSYLIKHKGTLGFLSTKKNNTEDGC
jgi:hypothetical protein